MNTDVQDWSTGKRITVGTGGVTEGYACAINSSGHAVLSGADDTPCCIADYTAAAAAEGVFWPLGPSQERWVKVSGATTVGAKLAITLAGGSFVATAAPGAPIVGIALTATAGAGYVKMKPVNGGYIELA